MGTSKALIAAPVATSVLTASANAVATVTSKSVPLVIQNGIQDLLVGFQAGSSSQPADDRVRAMRIYARACSNFPDFIADLALKQLLFSNPRNPFAPTPQDVHELCESIVNAFQDAVCNFYIGSGSWGYSLYGMLRKKFVGPLGPNPEEHGCLVPENLVCEWLRSEFQEIDEENVRSLLRLTDEMIAVRGFRLQAISKYEIVGVSDERFGNIPREAFPNHYRDLLLSVRSRYREISHRESSATCVSLKPARKIQASRW